MRNFFEKVASSGGKKAEGIVVGIPDPNFHKQQEAKKLDEVNEKLFGVEDKLKKDYVETVEKINDIYEELGDEVVRRIDKERQAMLADLRKHKKELAKQLEDIHRQGGLGGVKGES